VPEPNLKLQTETRKQTAKSGAQWTSDMQTSKHRDNKANPISSNVSSYFVNLIKLCLHIYKHVPITGILITVPPNNKYALCAYLLPFFWLVNKMR
jgi:hypothetical protein